jgi:hypothetical protein
VLLRSYIAQLYVFFKMIFFSLVTEGRASRGSKKKFDAFWRELIACVNPALATDTQHSR